ncbi:MAG: AAA family ATPase, partial [Oscillospiraceae bacterium]|nr:AAA family ATPase [Oscillospiraceae bacterium]
MNEIKEMTAPDTSVGADEGQPLNQAESSIADEEEDYKEILRRMKEELRYADGSHLRTFSLNNLYEQTFTGRPPIIDGLLPSGTYFLAGAPKVGKSFFVAQVAYHVSTGTPLWEHPV